MKTCRLMIVAGPLLALVVSQPVAAAWWPFSGAEEPAKSSKSKTSKKKTSGGHSSKPAEKSSSGFHPLKSLTSGTKHAISNTTSGTKRVFTKTAAGTKKLVTNPASLVSSPEKSTPQKKQGASTRESRNKTTKEDPGFFKRWFASEPEPEPPKSIKEWMSLKRLDP